MMMHKEYLNLPDGFDFTLAVMRLILRIPHLLGIILEDISE